MSSLSKAIEDEKKVNSYAVKGSVDQLSIARFKVYHAAKIVSVKYDDRSDKRFNPSKLAKSLEDVQTNKLNYKAADVAPPEKSLLERPNDDEKQKDLKEETTSRLDLIRKQERFAWCFQRSKP